MHFGKWAAHGASHPCSCPHLPGFLMRTFPQPLYVQWFDSLRSKHPGHKPDNPERAFLQESCSWTRGKPDTESKVFIGFCVPLQRAYPKLMRRRVGAPDVKVYA